MSFGFQFWDSSGSPLYGSNEAGFVIIEQFLLTAANRGAFARTWYVDPLLTDFTLVTHSGGEYYLALHSDGGYIMKDFLSNGFDAMAFIDGLSGSDSIVGTMREVIISGTVIIPDTWPAGDSGQLVVMLYGR